MKRLKRFMALLASGAMLFSLAACTKNADKDPNYEYGRYVEVDITPPDMNWAPAAFYSDETGLYDIVYETYDNTGDSYQYYFLRYRSTDRGANWEPVDVSWADKYTQEIDYDDPNLSLVTRLTGYMAFLSDGTLVAGLSTYDYQYGGQDDIRFIKIDMDGNEEPFELEGFDMNAAGNNSTYIENFIPLGDDRVFASMRTHRYDDNDEWLGSDSNNYIYDGNTGRKLAELNLGSDAYLSLSNKDALIFEEYDSASGESKFAVYSTTDGSRMDVEMPSLEEIRKAGFSVYNGSSILNEDLSITAYDQADEMRRFYAGDKESEQVMKALNYSFGSPLKYMGSWLVLDADGNILMSVQDREQGSFLLRYEWDDDAIASSDQTLKVFSLYNSETTRLALSQYKLNHPEVDVEYTYALERYYWDDEQDIMSVEDALRNLNNELLTGNGPDVLILDEMPVQSYIDKGILEDISAAVEGSGIYTSLLEPYKSGGKLYAVPARVGIPFMFGRDGDLQQYATLGALVDAIEAGPGLIQQDYNYEYPEYDWDNMTDELYDQIVRESYDIHEWDEIPVMHFDSISELIAVFFEMSAPEIYSEADGLDREALTTFLDYVKRVSDKYELAVEPEINYGDEWGRLAVASGSYGMADSYIRWGGTFNNYSSSFSRFTDLKSRVGYLQLVNYSDLRPLGNMVGQMTNGVTYYSFETYEKRTFQPYEEVFDVVAMLAKGMAGNVFVPQVMAGVTANSSNKELATDFIASMLEMGVQGYYMYDGLPVTSEANKKMYDAYNVRDRYMVEEDIYPFEMDYDAFFNQLETPYYMNSYLLEIIYNHASAYCREEMSLEQAVGQIVSETEMYFAERQ